LVWSGDDVDAGVAVALGEVDEATTVLVGEVDLRSKGFS
jgi:hypothetical protein